MAPDSPASDSVSPASPRSFATLEYHEANYRVCSPDNPSLFRIIRRLRNRLEAYIRLHPEFKDSHVPLPELPLPAPEPALRMHRASQSIGVGPMAAVAGTFSQLAAEELLRASGKSPDPETSREVIIENGGDIFMVLMAPLTIGLWVGHASPFRNLAFRLSPEDSPLAICSSSSSMGHSYSEGSCDLVTVLSPDASLADACATAVCNRIRSYETFQEAVEWGASLKNVRGILAIRGGKMAVAGEIPRLQRHAEHDLGYKITHHRDSSFPKNSL